MIQKNIDQIIRTKTSIDGDERLPARDDNGDFKITVDNFVESITRFISIAVVPVGSIIPFSGPIIPDEFLEIDGSVLSRITYADLFAAISELKGEFTVTIATPGVFTLSGHGLATGDCVELTTDGALPTGLSANTNYYVIYSNANSFWLATSHANAIAGTKINTSGTQSGTHSLRHVPFGISGAANFLLPDGRGVSLEGTGTQGTAAWAAAEYLGGLGQYKQDQFQSHKMIDGHPKGGIGEDKYVVFYGPSTIYYGTSGLPTTDGTNGTPRTGKVTKGPRVGVTYIIKY